MRLAGLALFIAACGASGADVNGSEAAETNSTGGEEEQGGVTPERPKLGHGCASAAIGEWFSSETQRAQVACACGDESACARTAGTPFVCHRFGESAESGCDVAAVLAANPVEVIECLPNSDLSGQEESYRQCACGVEAACFAIEETELLHRYLGLDPAMPEAEWFEAHEAGVDALFRQ